MQEICEKYNFLGHLSVECNGSIWARKKIQFSQLDIVDMNNLNELLNQRHLYCAQLRMLYVIEVRSYWINKPEVWNWHFQWTAMFTWFKILPVFTGVWFFSQLFFSNISFKVEKILRGILDLIPSYLPSVKNQSIGEKVFLRCKGKTLLDIVNKLWKTKSLLTSPSNVLPYYLK